MRFQLPPQIRQDLASRNSRLHHLLWHSIRNSWHLLTVAERRDFGLRHPKWVPNVPRFIINAAGDEAINPEGGESFLYMHRQMIFSLNAQLLALGQPVLSPWQTIPGVDDPDYPVPGRTENGDADDPKSDRALADLKARETTITNREVLRTRSLAFVGAYVESMIHDWLHGRFAAESPGLMNEFPSVESFNVNPEIEERFMAPEVDWLGHPFSSHVNSDFWMLHGWVDSFIEKWRDARGLADVPWTDTWQGDVPEEEDPRLAMAGSVPGEERLLRLNRHLGHHGHDHGHGGHGHGGGDLQSVLQSVSRFSHCVVGFDYIAKKGLQMPVP